MGFVKLDTYRLPYDWPEGWLIVDCLRISWTTQSQVSLSHARSSASRNVPTSGVWMNSIFTTRENVEFCNREVTAVLGHSDSSSRSGQSNWNISRARAYGKELWWRRCSSFLPSSVWVSNLPVFGLLIDWIVRVWILVQWWSGYKIWFVPCTFSRLWVIDFKKLMQDV
jgi:hypothetical protein